MTMSYSETDIETEDSFLSDKNEEALDLHE